MGRTSQIKETEKELKTHYQNPDFIIECVREYQKTHNKNGTAKKYGITPVTVGRWVEKYGTIAAKTDNLQYVQDEEATLSGVTKATLDIIKDVETKGSDVVIACIDRLNVLVPKSTNITEIAKAMSAILPYVVPKKAAPLQEPGREQTEKTYNVYNNFETFVQNINNSLKIKGNGKASKNKRNTTGK